MRLVATRSVEKGQTSPISDMPLETHGAFSWGLKIKGNGAMLLGLKHSKKEIWTTVLVVFGFDSSVLNNPSFD